MGLAAIFALTLSAFARQYANEALKTVGEQYGTQLTIAALPLEVNIAFVVFCALLGGLIASIITRRAIAKIEQVY